MSSSSEVPVELSSQGAAEDVCMKIEESARDALYRTEVPSETDVSASVPGFLWAIVFSGPLWLLIGAATWYACGHLIRVMSAACCARGQIQSGT